MPLNAQDVQALSRDFPDAYIGRKPRPTRRDNRKGVCRPQSEGGDAPPHQDYYCGKYHGLPAKHLEFVGHAAVRQRLGEVDPGWSWSPMATDDQGNPVLVRDSKGAPVGLWIVLTVKGSEIPGFGSCLPSNPPDWGDKIKELIGDAIRNAAMSRGVALKLWTRVDDVPDDPPSDQAPAPQEPQQQPKGAPAPDGEEPMADEALMRQCEHACFDLPRDYTIRGDGLTVQGAWRDIQEGRYKPTKRRILALLGQARKAKGNFVTGPQIGRLNEEAKKAGLDEEALKGVIRSRWPFESRKMLTRKQCSELLKDLREGKLKAEAGLDFVPLFAAELDQAGIGYMDGIRGIAGPPWHCEDPQRLTKDQAEEVIARIQAGDPPFQHPPLTDGKSAAGGGQ